VTAAVHSSHGGAPVLVESSRALPLVSITIAQRTGSIEDPAGKEGLSRATGRLVRRTGNGLTTEELDEKIDSLGASLGVDVSHSTVTVHGAVIARSLDAFADLLVGVLARPSLSEEELSKLKRETVAELVEARDHDRELAQRWFRERLFEGHPYARPVSGTPKTIASLTPSDVHHLYRTTYTAQNLVFAFAGDIDPERAHAIAERVVAALPPGAAREDTVPEPVMKPGRRLVIVDKPERTQTQILIGCLGTEPHDPDHIALHVGNTVFGGTFTARLMNEVRSKRGWSYGAYSNLPYDRRRRGFSLWTFPKASDAAPCIALELALLEKWWKDGVTAKELSWAKRYLVRSHAFAVDTAPKRVGQALEEEIYELPARYHAEYLDRVEAVTLDEVNRAIRARITPEDLVITILGTRADIEGPVRDAIPNLASVDVVPFDS
jgi:zinc protease